MYRILAVNDRHAVCPAAVTQSTVTSNISHQQLGWWAGTNRFALRNETKLIVNITNQRIKDVIDGHDYRHNERTITSGGR